MKLFYFFFLFNDAINFVSINILNLDLDSAFEIRFDVTSQLLACTVLSLAFSNGFDCNIVGRNALRLVKWVTGCNESQEFEMTTLHKSVRSA